jgi:hypothetical protein
MWERFRKALSPRRDPARIVAGGGDGFYVYRVRFQDGFKNLCHSSRMTTLSNLGWQPRLLSACVRVSAIVPSQLPRRLFNLCMASCENHGHFRIVLSW